MNQPENNPDGSSSSRPDSPCFEDACEFPHAAASSPEVVAAEEPARWCRGPLDAFYLTGPTASGKTSLGLAVAQRMDAEIISMDSMAIYRGMDIGTAKPTAADRLRVPHHLLDIVDPNQNYSVSCYVAAAHEMVKEISQRGKRVLFVGGTPLYLKSLLRGMFMGPPANEEFRTAVARDIEQFGIESLRDRLRQVDPLSAHKLHPHDERRMIRALEVAMATGRPLSHWQTQFETPSTSSGTRAAVIGLDRAWLHQRINHRVEQMIQLGLEDEVRRLNAQHGMLTGTAGQAVGYKEMQAWILGNGSHEQMVDEIKAHTRQFARRQEIWFRGLSELRRFELKPDSSQEKLADDIAAFFSASAES